MGIAVVIQRPGIFVDTVGKIKTKSKSICFARSPFWALFKTGFYINDRVWPEIFTRSIRPGGELRGCQASPHRPKTRDLFRGRDACSPFRGDFNILPRATVLPPVGRLIV